MRDENVKDDGGEAQLIEVLTDVAVAAVATLHEFNSEYSEATTETLGRALIKFVEDIRAGSPTTRPGHEEFRDRIVEKIAQAMRIEIVDETPDGSPSGTPDPTTLN